MKTFRKNSTNIFFGRSEAKQKMTHIMYTLLVVTILLTASQVVTGPHVYDTGNYMILQEPREENFTLFDGKCRGKLRVITRSVNRYLVSIQRLL